MQELTELSFSSGCSQSFIDILEHLNRANKRGHAPLLKKKNKKWGTIKLSFFYMHDYHAEV